MRLLVAAVALVVLTVLEAGAESTGSALPGLGAYDEFMAALMRTWDMPGAGLAVALEGKLVLARGYGRANKERNVPVEPTSLFRFATLAVRTADDFAWVVAFNERPLHRGAFRAGLDRGLWAAKAKVRTWPHGDLFR